MLSFLDHATDYGGEMSLNAIVKMRLDREKHAIYEAEAAARGLPLTTWLRRRLDLADELHGQLRNLQYELTSLRLAVGRLEEQGDQRPAAGEGPDGALLAEALLLLRALAAPKHVQMVQAELRRAGLAAWEAGA